MSGLEIREPATSGRILIRTSKGDLNIELWSKECPLASRNFVQLCKEGYYNGSIFHRIVKDFLVQGGDPSGTGLTCESIYSSPYASEINQRLRYRYRGLLGIANAGKNTNGSQFFITLSAQEALNGKNTLFGRVVGNSIYSLVEIASVEVDSEDRPIGDYPPRILECIVQEDPFPDIVPRAVKPAFDKVERTHVVEKTRVIQARRTNILSFGEDEKFSNEKVRRDAQNRYERDESNSSGINGKREETLAEIARIEEEIRRLSQPVEHRVESQRKLSRRESREEASSSDQVVKRLKEWAVKVKETSKIGMAGSNWLESAGKIKFASSHE